MTMTTSPAMRRMIEDWEGLVLKAYPDPGTGGEPWTIGYGHTGPDVHPGEEITGEQADGLLTADLAAFERSVASMVGSAPTSQQQFDAMVSFAYNCGAGALHGSIILKCHLAGDYAGAAADFSHWDEPTSLPGILRRRQGEAAVYLHGVYTT